MNETTMAPEKAEKLKTVLAGLDPDNDAHWTKQGMVDLNYLKEAIGEGVKRSQVHQIDPDIHRDIVRSRKSTAAAEEPAVKGEADGIDVPEAEKQNAQVNPHDVGGHRGEGKPHVVAQRVIDLLDQAQKMMTAEVRQKHPDLWLVFQQFQAQRPNVIERQKRLEARAAQEAIAEQHAAEEKAKADAKAAAETAKDETD